MRSIAFLAAGLALAGQASAERLHRCEASLAHADGALTIPGWGLTEAQAGATATRAAWLVASVYRYPELLAGRVIEPGPAQKRDHALVASLSDELGWLVPGFSVSVIGCTSTALDADRGQAWSALWWDADKATLRNDPAVAIEAARRRRCLGVWQHRAVRGAEAADQASTERYAAAYQIESAARSGFNHCMSKADYTLVLAGAPLPRPAPGGTVACSRPRQSAGEWRSATAFADDLEGARESALQLDAFLALRQAEQNYEHLAGNAGAIHQAAMMLGGLVVATDLAEQATLSCTQGPATPTRVTWTPAGGLRCDAWPVGPNGTQTAAPTDLNAATAARCDGPFRQALARDDWATAMACDRSCRADITLGQWESTSVIRPGEVDRTSSDAAARALAGALRSHDFHALGIVTGGLLFEPGMATTFRNDPGAFWGSIDQSVTSGAWEQNTKWTLVDGHWLLSFR